MNRTRQYNGRTSRMVMVNPSKCLAHLVQGNQTHRDVSEKCHTDVCLKNYKSCLTGWILHAAHDWHLVQAFHILQGQRPHKLHWQKNFLQLQPSIQFHHQTTHPMSQTKPKNTKLILFREKYVYVHVWDLGEKKKKNLSTKKRTCYPLLNKD